MTENIVAAKQVFFLKTGEFEIPCAKLESGKVVIYAPDLVDVLEVFPEDFYAAIDFWFGDIEYIPIPVDNGSVPGIDFDRLSDVIDMIADECECTKANQLRTDLVNIALNHLAQAANSSEVEKCAL